MAWHDVECDQCGETFSVQLYGKASSRQWKVDTWTWICDDCRTKARQEATQNAAKEAKEMGLPELTGTSKQIAWAETIRLEKIEAIESALQKDPDKNAYALFQNICSIHESRFWIDNRFETAEALIRWAAKNTKPAEEKAFEEEAAAEATLRPKRPKTETIAEISIVNENIKIRFPEKRDDFREIVKYGHFFYWDGSCWSRTIKPIDPTPEAKATEMGVVLLAAGFPVRIYDEQIRSSIIENQYQPEITKLIVARTDEKHKGKFGIRWRRRDGDYYTRAKRLPGARWSRPDVVVPAEHFDEVLDFAETEGFRITPGAMKLADMAQEAKEKALVVDAVDSWREMYY